MNNSKLFDYSSSEVDSFVESLKNEPLLKGCNINKKNANLYKQMLESKKACLKCKGYSCCTNSVKGYMKVVVNDTLKMVMCNFAKSEEINEDSKNKIKTLFISDETLNANFDDVIIDKQTKKQARNGCINFVSNIDNKQSGIYLCGEFGIGKTYLLSCVANELANKGKTVLYVYFPDLVRYMNGIMYENQKLEAEILSLKECDVLILDDLGAESLNSWFRDQVLGPVLNYRYLSKKPICVSSNLTPQDMLVHFSETTNDSDKVKGGRITKRLFELAKNVYIL